jgi:hypothetical protein
MQHINNTPADSGLGDTLKVAFDKVNANFNELVAIDSSFSGDIQTLNTIISNGSTLNHTHTISQIIGLQTALSGKVSTSTFNTQILAINASIQAINSTLSDIIDILNTKIGDAPFSGVTYGRRDGAWVEVTGGGGPTGDFVPYTGGTKDVVLSANSITANGGIFSNWDGGLFSVNSQSNPPNINFTDDREYDGDNVSVNLSVGIGGGVSYAWSNTTNGNLTSLQAKNEFIVQCSSGVDPVIANNLYVTPTFTESDKKVVSNEGFEGNYVKFNTTNTETIAAGKLYWNDVQGTMNIGLKGAQTNVKSGVDLVVRVVNKVTPNTTLTKAAYQAVRISGAQGQRLAVKLAQANNDNNSADTIGLVCETINANQEGYIMTVGQLENINTTGNLQGESWSDGDVLYLSPTTAGRLTNVKPSAPGHIVVMGYVEYAHANNGKIYVKIMNGWELDELHNVNISAATSGQVLRYDGTNWINATVGVPTDLYQFNTKQGFYLFEDFLGSGLNAAASVGWNGESAAAGSSIVTVNSYPNRTNQQGVLRLATGTASTGLAQGRLGDNNGTSHFLGNGVYTMQYFVNIETLSDITNRFYSIFGATTNANFANTNGIFFIYDEGIGTYGSASPNWKCITRNSTITSTITGIPVVASQWYVLKIVVNANASSVEFFINGVSVATHTTNIVSLITPRIANVKTIGTTNRNAYVDYAIIQQIYTTPRTI